MSQVTHLCAPVNKTFTARVRYDPVGFDWVEITAVKNNSVLTLELAPSV